MAEILHETAALTDNFYMKGISQSKVYVTLWVYIMDITKQQIIKNTYMQQ